MLRAQFLPFVAGNLVSHSLCVLIDLFTFVFASILNFSKNRKVIFSHVYGAKKRTQLRGERKSSEFPLFSSFPRMQTRRVVSSRRALLPLDPGNESRKMADETTNTERSQKYTLFPIIGSNSGALGTQTSPLFPCVSVDAQKRSSNVKRGEF